MVGIEGNSPAVRIAKALIFYIKYIQLMIWPTKLGIFYAYSFSRALIFYAAPAILLLAAISILVFRFGKKFKYLPVGWLWFLGTLVPVIGLVQVGTQSIADRYTYMPFLGLFIILVWGFGDILAKWPVRKFVIAIPAAIVILVLATCSYVQAGYWRDGITIFKHTLEVTKNNGIVNNNVVYHNLGIAYHRCDQIDNAIDCWNEMIALNLSLGPAPKSLYAVYYSLGTAYYQKGQIDKALDCWNQTVILNPRHNKAHNNLGALYFGKGQVDLAITHWKQALLIDPNDVNARQNLDLAITQKEKNNISGEKK